MTVDLSTARPGCEVTFRDTGRATVRIASPNKDGTITLYFEGSMHGYYCWISGRRTKCEEDLFDIVSITDPPLTEAERLAEIVKEAKPFVHYLETYTQSWDRDMVINTARAILALAEGSGR